MASCGLNTMRASAVVSIGGHSVSTPDIINITINKTRGQLTATAQVQYHATTEESTDAGSDIVITIMGQRAFTGTIKRIDISPSFRCAGEKIVRIQAEDYLNRIANKAITRRQKNPSLGPMVFITSIYKRVTVGFDKMRDRFDVDGGQSPLDVFTHSTNFREIPFFIAGGETNTMGALHPVTKVADAFPKPGGGSGGMVMHSHESLDFSERGFGPATAVFGSK